MPAYADAGFVSNIMSYQPWGQSNYNALQLSFKRNFTHGLQFQAAYTWSHTLDNSTADVNSTVLTPRRPQDFQCFSCEYSTSALDRRQRATLALTYDMPFFKELELVRGRTSLATGRSRRFTPTSLPKWPRCRATPTPT